MSSCEAEHKQCLEHIKSVSVQKLPTRLLKIEEQNGGVVGVRLVDTSDVEGTYACLSYCWGSNRQELMTTTANLDKYRHKIPWQELPSTLGDAIKLCYRLGFQYLWVDSLCIVQNDEQDWLREASNMAGIYSKSALTLAVHLCDDASESFLQKRLLNTKQWSDGRYGCARVPFTDPSTGDKREMYLWEDRSFEGSRFLDGGWAGIKNFMRDQPSRKWFNRAWTYQEWFLSPRVLHIHTMTVWDCFQSYGNELEKRFLRQQFIIYSRKYFSQLSWSDIVQGFTARQITLEKDRLPALAGLAERYRAETGSTYLAGIWVEDLPKSLLWTRPYECSVLSKPITYRAPTWSWASLEGEVSSDFVPCYYEALPTSKILGYYCQYDPPDTFATVIDGWLDVEGSMSIVSGWELQRDNSWASDIRLFNHDQVERTESQEYWCCIAKLDLDQSIEEEIKRSKVCLLEIMARNAEGVSFVVAERYALVLKSVQRHGMGQDCFQRLGIARSISPAIPTFPYVTERWARRTIRLI